MCSTDSVLFFASEPISEATTAKPLPASPALAASIDALSERRFVRVLLYHNCTDNSAYLH